MSILYFLWPRTFYISSRPGRSYVNTAVVGLLVSPAGMLLAVRGPDTTNAELHGLWAGIGGKVDGDETLDEALDREFMEEVGVNISDMPRSPLGVTRQGDTTVQHFIVYSDKDVTPNVPADEAKKVVTPTFFKINALPTSDMVPELGHLVLSNLSRMRFAALKTGAVAAPAKWIERAVELLPPGIGALLVNNKDSLCTAYALNAQLPPDEKLDLERLAAAIPEHGYAPTDLLNAKQLRQLGIWDSISSRWTSGGPESKILLMYTQNGDSGHYDGLFKMAGPDDIRVQILYPNGMSAAAAARTGVYTSLPGMAPPTCEKCKLTDDECECDDTTPDDSVSQAASSVSSVSSKSTGISGLTMRASDVGTTTGKLRRSAFERFAGKMGLKTASGKAAVQSTAPPADTFWSALGNIIHAAALRDSIHMVFSSRDDVATTVKPADHVVAPTPTVENARFARLFMAPSIDAVLEATPSWRAMTVYVRTAVNLRSSIVNAGVWLDLTAPTQQRNTRTLFENVTAVKTQDKPDSLAKDLGSLFGLAFRPPAAANNPTFSAKATADALARVVMSYSDRGTDGMKHIYMRLLAGWFAAAVGATSTATVDHTRTGASERTLFPSAEHWSYIFDANENQLADGDMPTFRQRRGITGWSIFPIVNFHGGVWPAVARGSDWRVVLASLHLPFLGFTTNPMFGDAQSARLHALTQFQDRIPRIAILSGANNAALRGNWPAQADWRRRLEDPASWRDAIIAMLRNFGGSAAFNAALEDFGLHAFRHMSPEIAEIPAPLSRRYRNDDDYVMTLAARLFVMRVMIPMTANVDALAANNDTARNVGAIMGATMRGANIDKATIVAAHAADPNDPAVVLANRWWRVFFVRSNIQGIRDLHAQTFAAANMTEVDAEWFQYFSCEAFTDLPAVPGSLDGLERMLRHMTHAEFVNLMCWLSDDGFAARWRLRVQANGEEEVHVRAPLHRTYGGVDDAHAIPAVNRPETWLNGYYMSREASMTTTNLVVSSAYTVPSGVNAIKSVRSGVEIYHSDDAALDLAQQMLEIDGGDYLRRLAAFAITVRSAADSAAEKHMVSASRILLSAGTIRTGSVDLDAVIERTNAVWKIGDAQKLLADYMHDLSVGIQSQGFAIDLVTQSNLKIAVYRWQQLNGFEYNGSDRDQINLTWSCLHPAMSNIYTPDLRRTPIILAPKLQYLANRVTGDQTPWDSWVAATSDFAPTDLMGAFRVWMYSMGWTVDLTFSTMYKARDSHPLPTAYPILADYDHEPTRRSDTLPYSTTYGTEATSWYTPVFGYSYDYQDDAWLRPGRLYNFSMSPVLGQRAPIMNGRAARAYTTASPTGWPAALWGARSLEGIGLYAGMTNAPDYVFIDAAGYDTQPVREYAAYGGYYTTGNPTVTRMRRGALAIAGINPNERATDGNNVEFGDDYTYGGVIVSSLLEPTAIAGVSNIDMFYTIQPAMAARFDRWHWIPEVDRYPIDLSPRIVVARSDDTGLTSDNFPNQFAALQRAQIWSTAGPGRDSRVPAVPGVDVGLTRNITFDEPHVVLERPTYDPRHLVEGIQGRSAAQLERKIKAAEDEAAKLKKELAKAKAAEKKPVRGRKAVATSVASSSRSSASSVTTDLRSKLSKTASKPGKGKSGFV
ncbi:hypothetical protein [Rhizoctonia solani dsRNA virus 10]|uniref:Nudix hydrolase domain-containing protein n=1 Tax=Rhizoctonia solani dsRNA virus 10 TaxID=2600095 RepID=A0A5B8HAB8_9VIRU|nr:hypothetical protein [Rhizoctonia solani dsRNA virus 10]